MTLSLADLQQQRSTLQSRLAGLGDFRSGSITGTGGRCGNPRRPPRKPPQWPVRTILGEPRQGRVISTSMSRTRSHCHCVGMRLCDDLPSSAKFPRHH
jgi:hypothetical protein